jgi:type II secretory pathway component GspD/PulD (secretin)
MKTALKTLLTALVALWIGVVSGQSLEVIELRSRAASEVLPTLLPLVEPGGTLTGLNNQLFLRTSPRNRQDILRVLAAIDKPARRLIIHVAHERQQAANDRGTEAVGQVIIGNRPQAHVEGRVWDSRSQRAENAAQRVQTVEGGRAFIQVGRSLPVPMRQIAVGPAGAIVNDSIVYRDIGSGFYASPRVSGERVTLDISQQTEQLDGRRPGGIASQQLATTVSGRLGEWIELGGTGQQASNRQGGAFSVGTGQLRDNRSIWLMVEEID